MSAPAQAPAVHTSNDATFVAGLSAARGSKPAGMPPTVRAPSREKGDMLAQHLEGDSRDPVEDIGPCHVKEDADEDVQAPAVHTSNDVTVNAELSATHISNNDQPARMPPLDRAPYRAKDLDDMLAQHLEGNARGPVEDMSLLPLDKDSAQNVPVPPSSVEDVCVAAGPAERSAAFKSSTDLCGHVLPLGRAPSRVKYSGDMPAQHLEGNSRGPVEDIGPYHVKEDSTEDVPALLPAVSTSNDATVAAGLSTARRSNNDQQARLPPTVRAPCRAKDSGDMPAQYLDGDAHESVEDIGPCHSAESCHVTVNPELSAARMVNNDQPARMPPLDRAPCRAKDLGDMPAQYLEGDSRGPVEDMSLLSWGKYFAEKRQASSLTLNGIPRNMRTWRARRWGTCNVGKMCTSHREKRQHSGWIMWGILCLCLIQASAFTPGDLGALKSAKSSCLAEASSGNCPNFEATHGEIGTWNTAKVTTLHHSESPVHIAVDACFYVC
jgi:hypothetical protein